MRAPAWLRAIERRLSLRRVLALQSAYWLATGLWPVLHLRSFLWVVGPKPDRFQFFSTTWLIVAVGAVLGLGASQKQPAPAAPALGVLAAAALSGVEIAFLRRIRKVFLLDLLAEGLTIAAILHYWVGPGRRREEQAAPAAVSAPRPVDSVPGTATIVR